MNIAIADIEAAVSEQLGADLGAAVRLNIAALDLHVGPGDGLATEDIGSLLAQLVAPAMAAPGVLPLVCAEIINGGSYVRLEADEALVHPMLQGRVGFDLAECFAIPILRAAEAASPSAVRTTAIELTQPRAEALGWASVKLQMGALTIIAAYGYGEATAISDTIRVDGVAIHAIGQQLATKHPLTITMFEPWIMFGMYPAVDEIHPTSDTRH